MLELSAGGSVALGVFVGLLSTSIQSVGLTLQRKSHLLEDEKEESHTRRPPYRRRRWQLGMLMFIIANLVGSTIQITTLPLPVLSTLQASGLVFNSICATLILSEPFTRYSLVGTLLVTAGAVLIGTFGALTEPSHTLDQLLGLLGRAAFLIWLFATLLVTALLFIAQWLLKRIAPRPTPTVRLLRGMFFGAMSGILSAHCLLIAKSAVELLVRTIVDRHNQFDRWQSWVILLGLVAFALTQLYYLHRGLKLCSTSILYPFVFCIYNIIAILDGLIYFRQTSRLPVRDACLIALGTVILLAGVAALSWRLDDQDPSTSTRSRHQRRMSRRSVSGIPPPRTALTPGLGFINPSGEDGSDADSPYFRPTRLDEEEAPASTSNGAGALGLGIQDAGASPSEQTPLLLRTSTAPAPGPRSPSYGTGSGPSPGALKHMRRMTIADEAGEIWDELNDRGTGIPRSASLRSPRESRVRRGGRGHERTRSGAGTVAGGKGSGRSGSWWGTLTRTGGPSGRSVSHGDGDARVAPAHAIDPDADADADADVDPDAPLLGPGSGSGSGRRRSWTLRMPRVRGRAAERDEGKGNWFKLWRRGGDRGDRDDRGGDTSGGGEGSANH